MPKRIDALTDAQRAQFDVHADKWIEIGLRTGPADRDRFEAAARDCYRFAGIPFPDVVVWVPSPLVLAFAAPAAAFAIELLEGGPRAMGAQRRNDAVGGAVADAAAEAVAVAVDDAVAGAVAVAVDGAVAGAVRGAVDRAVDDAVDDAVADAVDDAVAGAVDRTVDGAVAAVRDGWNRRLGGQLWAGGWWYGAAGTSFFRDVCKLELDGDLWERARAYEATMESACWWWPHRRFVIVSERPLAIHRELTNPGTERGWNSHRLHHEHGPAVVWPDGWGVWAVHGVRVPQQVVEAPETLTVEQVLAEPNVEVRRVMLERFGFERLIRDSNARLVDRDEFGTLYRIPLEGDEDLMLVCVVNSTPEADGSFKDYVLRVPPSVRSAREAVAWTFDLPQSEYLLGAES